MGSPGLVAIFVGLWGDARQGELSEVGKVMKKCLVKKIEKCFLNLFPGFCYKISFEFGLLFCACSPCSMLHQQNGVKMSSDSLRTRSKPYRSLLLMSY